MEHIQNIQEYLWLVHNRSLDSEKRKRAEPGFGEGEEEERVEVVGGGVGGGAGDEENTRSLCADGLVEEEEKIKGWGWEDVEGEKRR